MEKYAGEKKELRTIGRRHSRPFSTFLGKKKWKKERKPG